jgi:hypothetical protein
MFGNELRRACAVATDRAFLAALSSSTARGERDRKRLRAAALDLAA